MRGTLLLYLLFAAAATAAMWGDRFEPGPNALVRLLTHRAPVPGEEPGEKPPADPLADPEARAADLERRARRLVAPEAALAGTEAAFDALLGRLAELEAGADGDVAAQLDALERDFAIREQMVRSAQEVSRDAVPEWREACAALEAEMAALADADAARVAAIQAALVRARAALEGRGGDATPFLDAAASARAEFDRRGAALRARAVK